jgi:sialic acid synthase SpsE
MGNQTFQIRHRGVGDSNPVFIVAEAGINHQGNVERALDLVDAVADSGADAIKFQTIDPDASYVPGTESHDVFSGKELNREEYEQIIDRCNDNDLIFFTTPGDFPSLSLCEELNVPAIKISSGLMTNYPLIQKALALEVPLLISTGASYMWEVEKLMSFLDRHGAPPYALLHCVSSYPAPDASLCLEVVSELNQRTPYPVGYSDHNLNDEACLGAVALGAKVIEKHITLDRNQSGEDHHISLEPDSFGELVSRIRTMETMTASRVKQPQEEEGTFRQQYRRKITASREIEEGEVIKRDAVRCMRHSEPGGLAPEQLDEVIERQAVRDIAKYNLITWESIR